MIGRKAEQQILTEAVESPKPQLLAVYGRRRVGKTFLVREVLGKRPRTTFIEVTGRKKGDRATQLTIFHDAVARELGKRAPVSAPTSWKEAFESFTRVVEADSREYVLFLDELPWLATRRSGCIEELDHFWNTRWSKLPHLTVVLCGSAAAWMLEKLVHAKGGLHNRITRRLHLLPFNLSDVRRYLIAQNISYTPLEILELYLCTGGVPYYLDWIRPGRSPMQTVQDLCFSDNGVLSSEFDTLMVSLFDEAEVHKRILSTLITRPYGAKRSELLEYCELAEGGLVSRALAELEAASFIARYIPIDGARHAYYQLTDPYVRFYGAWIVPTRRRATIPSDYWLKEAQTSRYLGWAGRSFEHVCLLHIDQILRALGISGMRVLPSTWRYSSRGEKGGIGTRGAQIDIVLDRADRVFTLCEVKFSREPIRYAEKIRRDLLNKISTFREVTQTKRSINAALVNAGGFAESLQFDHTLVGAVTGDELFAS